jgi:hypothetical protein
VQRRHVGSLALLTALTVGATGCGLLPLEPQGCPGALLEGALARDDGGGMGVHQPEVAITYPVVWPDGHQVQVLDGVPELVDSSGRVVGREGDHFSAAGGFSSGPNEVFRPCGAIEISRADE